MSRYGQSDYDDMFYELNEFLTNHKPSELLKLVMDVVDWWEECNMEIDDVVEVQHGHWEWSEHEREYLCSNCGTRFGFQQVYIKFNRLAAYCPICGAVMDRSEE